MKLFVKLCQTGPKVTRVEYKCDRRLVVDNVATGKISATKGSEEL